MALELSPRIRVNAICPEVVRTRLAEAWKDHEDPVGGIHCAQTIGGAGRRERGRVPGFGCASWITGETMIIDGGLLLGNAGIPGRTQH